MKIAFVGNSEPPQRLLELFRKFTPGRTGCWGQLQGVDNYKDADVFGVIDWLPQGLGIDETKCVFLGAHPPTMQAYRNMSNYKGIKMYDLKHTIGFLEWWLDYDYDYLSNLKPNNKSFKLGAIVSNADTQSYHQARLTWLNRFANTNPKDFDLYGRIKPSGRLKDYYRGACGSLDPRGAAASGGNNHMQGKELAYSLHKYMLEFDATGEHYFSERVLDCILMWSMPLYWGGSGLHKYIPENSFRYIDINKNGEDVLEIINSNFYEEHLEDLAKARDILLNELQLWPRIHQAIFGVRK